MIPRPEQPFPAHKPLTNQEISSRIPLKWQCLMGTKAWMMSGILKEAGVLFRPAAEDQGPIDADRRSWKAHITNLAASGLLAM